MPEVRNDLLRDWDARSSLATRLDYRVSEISLNPLHSSLPMLVNPFHRRHDATAQRLVRTSENPLHPKFAALPFYEVG